MEELRGRRTSHRHWLVIIGSLAGASAIRSQVVTPADSSAGAAPVHPPTMVLDHAPQADVVGRGSALVFRFAPGSEIDPLDFGSFRVLVDGMDCTADFQVTTREAWGPLRANPSVRGDGTPPMRHHVEARICSVRGLCASAFASVAAAPPARHGREQEVRAVGSSARARWFAVFSELFRRLLALPRNQQP